MDGKLKTGMLISMIPGLFLGCSSAPRGTEATFHNPNMDFGLIQTVAVLPFQDLTSASRAGERVRDVFMTMLQAKVEVYVIPPGEVARGINRAQLENPTAPTEEEVVKLAQNLEADVIVTGSVLEYGQLRSGTASANVCTVSVKMMEGQTGTVVWSASASRGGIGTSERLTGGGGQPMNVVTVQATSDLIDRLFQ